MTNYRNRAIILTRRLRKMRQVQRGDVALLEKARNIMKTQMQTIEAYEKTLDDYGYISDMQNDMLQAAYEEIGRLSDKNMWLFTALAAVLFFTIVAIIALL